MVFLFLKPFKVEDLQKFNIRLAFGTSLSVFLFILFFQPFEIPLLEMNNSLFFIAGFGVLMFALTIICLILIPFLLPKWFKLGQYDRGPSDFINLLLWTFNSAGFCFYLRFVGQTGLTLKVVIRIILTCLGPVLLIKFIYYIRFLSYQNDRLKEKIINRDVSEKEKEPHDALVFSSENGKDVLQVDSGDFLLAHSADNYVEIFHLMDGKIVSSLIRTTIKDVMNKMHSSPHILRCHRGYAVNPYKVQSRNKQGSSVSLHLSSFNKPVPVSRGYLISVRETLDKLIRK